MVVRTIGAFLLTNFCLAASATADTGHALSGLASIFAYENEITANGEMAAADQFTAAHKTLPFGTWVRVSRRDTGHEVVVRINDRGPFVKGRVIDLTPTAARELGFDEEVGLVPVDLKVLD